MKKENIAKLIANTTHVYTAFSGIQVRKDTDRFYFISAYTGVHSIAEKRWNKRVEAHFEGFITNNSSYIYPKNTNQ